VTVIDIRTFFTGYVLSILLCVVVMTSLWWQNRKRSPEIALWLVDYILQFIALLFITFRGILPDLFTIILANLFIIGGTIVLYIGLCRYVEKETRQLHNYAMLTVFTIVHLCLTYVYPDIELRVVNLSLALIYICSQCSWLMLRSVDAGLRPATRATGIVFVVFCLVSIVQIVVNLKMPKVNNIFVSGFFGVVAILMYQILFVALTFALFLLISRRLSMALESELLHRMQAQEELRQSEEKFAKSFQTSPYAIAITRLQDGKFIEVNDTFATITGYSREEVMAKSSIGLKLWVDEKDREEMVSALRQGLPVTGREYLFRRKNGEVLTGLFSAHTIQLSQEPCVLSSIDDITDRKRNEIYHEMNNEILQILSKPGSLHDSIQSVLTSLKTQTGFDAVGIRLRDGNDFPYFAQNGFSNDFLLTENTLTERDANGGMCRDKDGKVNLECTCGLVISGKTDSANPLFTKGGSFWINDSFPLLDLPSDQDPRLHPRNTCIHQGYASVALMPIRTKDQIVGLMQFNDRRKNRFSFTAIEQFEGIAANIGEALLRIQAEEQIKHMATHDLLTDLPSLRLAQDRFPVALNMARRYKKAVAVMFIDLDGFKTVNDTLGHDAGDYVLKQIAQRLLSCVRETDTVARVGGDEFLIIATEINTPENAAQIAEKVIQLASQPVIFKGQQAVIGTSIGIALFPEHGEDMDQLIKQADEAMYIVKNAGKNGFSFANGAIK
jgi:diguanylate cyclase (GGDEF)-like protein/PAS domain S-box-containing protein